MAEMVEIFVSLCYNRFKKGGGMMNVQLVRQDTNEKIIINKPVFRIGSEKGYVDYCINLSRISRSHCMIIFRDGKNYLVDTHSLNHTRLNGKRISPATEVLLNHGDRVSIADLDFRFENSAEKSDLENKIEETDYQVFISFKNVGQDAVLAEELFHELEKRGIRSFFSKYSINESAKSNYVDFIDEALDSSLLLVAVGTCKKNLTSKWVKSEINQFRTLMNGEEEDKRSIASLRSKEYPESELPSGIRSFQSFSDVNALVRFIEVFLGKDSTFQAIKEGTALLGNTPIFPNKSLDSNIFVQSTDHRYVQIGDLLNGKYKILSKIGMGGMSVVYKAIDEETCKQFAVKEFRKSNDNFNTSLFNCFRREAELLKFLDHPSIPCIYDVIDQPDSMILVMDFISGVSLRQMLTESGPMSEDVVLNYARQLCTVLDYLHTQKWPIIYRDLKPDNVLVLPNGGIKLIDFGIARHYSPSKLSDTAYLGTLGYAAPEQFGGIGQSDARTDIYNLGATLYHLITGKSPAEPPYEIFPIRQVNPKLSRGLEAVILKCTQRDPEKRFQSAKELLYELENIKTFFLRETWNSFLSHKSRKSKENKEKVPKPIVPAQPQLQVPGKVESLAETTVLQPASLDFEEPPKPIPSVEGFTIPGLISEPDMDLNLMALITKIKDLDPDSQRIVLELIDRLSR